MKKIQVLLPPKPRLLKEQLKISQGGDVGKFCFKNKDIYITCHIFLRVVFSFTMFGDLFEEDYSSVSNNNGKGKRLKTKALEPPAPREFTNLSGIRNQGGTCYLNSLLQTLHFTPEFRGMICYMHLASNMYPHLYM